MTWIWTRGVGCGATRTELLGGAVWPGASWTVRWMWITDGWLGAVAVSGLAVAAAAAGRIDGSSAVVIAEADASPARPMSRRRPVASGLGALSAPSGRRVADGAARLLLAACPTGAAAGAGGRHRPSARAGPTGAGPGPDERGQPARGSEGRTRGSKGRTGGPPARAGAFGRRSSVSSGLVAVVTRAGGVDNLLDDDGRRRGLRGHVHGVDLGDGIRRCAGGGDGRSGSLPPAPRGRGRRRPSRSPARATRRATRRGARRE